MYCRYIAKSHRDLLYDYIIYCRPILEYASRLLRRTNLIIIIIIII